MFHLAVTHQLLYGRTKSALVPFSGPFCLLLLEHDLIHNMIDLDIFEVLASQLQSNITRIQSVAACP